MNDLAKITFTIILFGLKMFVLGSTMVKCLLNVHGVTGKTSELTW